MLTKPKKDDIPVYYHYMIDQISDDADILNLLDMQLTEIVDFFKSISEDKLNYQYDTNKWTPKQILNHFTDMERVFQYRSLCFSRNDQQPLPGASENDYAAEIQANDFSLDLLLEDFIAVRKATLTLYKMIREDVWLYNGSANGVIFPLKAYPYVIYGHTLHHINLIKERYL